MSLVHRQPFPLPSSFWAQELGFSPYRSWSQGNGHSGPSWRWRGLEAKAGVGEAPLTREKGLDAAHIHDSQPQEMVPMGGKEQVYVRVCVGGECEGTPSQLLLAKGAVVSPGPPMLQHV